MVGVTTMTADELKGFWDYFRLTPHEGTARAWMAHLPLDPGQHMTAEGEDSSCSICAAMALCFVAEVASLVSTIGADKKLSIAKKYEEMKASDPALPDIPTDLRCAECERANVWVCGHG